LTRRRLKPERNRKDLSRRPRRENSGGIAARPEFAARPEIAARPESEARPEIVVRRAVGARPEPEARIGNRSGTRGVIGRAAASPKPGGRIHWPSSYGRK